MPYNLRNRNPKSSSKHGHLNGDQFDLNGTAELQSSKTRHHHHHLSDQQKMGQPNPIHLESMPTMIGENNTGEILDIEPSSSGSKILRIIDCDNNHHRILIPVSKIQININNDNNDEGKISFSPPSSTTLKLSLNRSMIKKEIQSLVLWRSPFKTIYYAWHQLIQLLNNLSQWIIHHSRLCLSVTFFLFILVLLLRIDGQHQPYVQYLYKRMVWCAYWCFLGILSSVGLGTGLHTFILYLGPHISEVTRAAYICKSLDFPEPPYPDQIICPTDVVETSITVWAIMSKVRLESFMWGAGTALGELPPYFISRAHRLAAGNDGPDSLLDEFEELEDLVPALEPGVIPSTNDQQQQQARRGSSTPSMAATIKTNMITFMKRMGFFGILACASIPNPLFDLAGIICGLSGIPFWTFFGATLLGKAVIKMHIQMLVVIIVFNETYVQTVLSFCKNIPYVGHYIHNPLRDYLEQQKKNLNRRPGDESTAKPPSGPGAWISFMFELFVLGMVTYFLVSIINSMAQSNLKQRLIEEMEKKNHIVDHGKKKGKTIHTNEQQQQQTETGTGKISGMSPKKIDKND